MLQQTWGRRSLCLGSGWLSLCQNPGGINSAAFNHLGGRFSSCFLSQLTQQTQQHLEREPSQRSVVVKIRQAESLAFHFTASALWVLFKWKSLKPWPLTARVKPLPFKHLCDCCWFNQHISWSILCSLALFRCCYNYMHLITCTIIHLVLTKHSSHLHSATFSLSMLHDGCEPSVGAGCLHLPLLPRGGLAPHICSQACAAETHMLPSVFSSVSSLFSFNKQSLREAAAFLIRPHTQQALRPCVCRIHPTATLLCPEYGNQLNWSPLCNQTCNEPAISEEQCDSGLTLCSLSCSSSGCWKWWSTLWHQARGRPAQIRPLRLAVPSTLAPYRCYHHHHQPEHTWFSIQSVRQTAWLNIINLSGWICDIFITSVSVCVAHCCAGFVLCNNNRDR